jgi:hypothetical protein
MPDMSGTSLPVKPFSEYGMLSPAAAKTADSLSFSTSTVTVLVTARVSTLSGSRCRNSSQRVKV